MRRTDDEPVGALGRWVPWRGVDVRTRARGLRDRLTPRRSPADLSLRTVAHVLGLVVLVALVAPFVVHAVPPLVGAEHSYVVTSGSMQPAIGVGSVVVVEAVDPARVDRGDVITFTRGTESQPTTHRVVEVVDRGSSVAFRTMGDANEEPDPHLVPPERLEGRVMTVAGVPFVIPYVGYAIHFANTRTGFVLLFVLPVSLLVASEVWSVLSSTRTGPDGGRSGGSGGDAEASGTTPRQAGRGPAAAVPRRDGVAPADGENDGDGTYTLLASELRLGAAVLALFAAYSLWVAYATTTVWSVGVAAATLVAFALVAGLYVVGGPAEATTSEREPDPTASSTEAPSGDRDGEDAPATSTDEAGGPEPRDGRPDGAPTGGSGASTANGGFSRGGTGPPTAVDGGRTGGDDDD